MDLTYVVGSDWVGLYADGRILIQDRSLEVDDLAELFLEEGVASFERKAVDEMWFFNYLYFPADLKDVRFRGEVHPDDVKRKFKVSVVKTIEAADEDAAVDVFLLGEALSSQDVEVEAL